MIAIFDIDGVLADDAKTAKLDPLKTADLDLFTRLVPGLKPRGQLVKIARALKLTGDNIYILTARSEAVRFNTEDWLFAQGIDSKRLFMRPEGNQDGPVLLKLKMIKAVISELGLYGKLGTEIIAFEDNPAICAAFVKAGIIVCEVQ